MDKLFFFGIIFSIKCALRSVDKFCYFFRKGEKVFSVFQETYKVHISNCGNREVRSGKRSNESFSLFVFQLRRSDMIIAKYI